MECLRNSRSTCAIGFFKSPSLFANFAETNWLVRLNLWLLGGRCQYGAHNPYLANDGEIRVSLKTCIDSPFGKGLAFQIVLERFGPLRRDGRLLVQGKLLVRREDKKLVG